MKDDIIEGIAKMMALIGLIVLFMVGIGHWHDNHTAQLGKTINSYESDVLLQDEQIQDVHLRIAELTSQLKETKLNLNQKDKELYLKVNSIDAALYAKSKRWEKIKKVRSIAKNTIKSNRYPSRMNIVDLTRYATAVIDFSSEYDVPIPLILAVTRQESAFNPKAVSHAGAQGLMQLMPRTALECSDETGKRFSNIFHIGTNVQFGTFYLRKMLTRFKENTELAIKAYNAGPNYVTKVLANEYRSYPSETINYSKKVLEYLKEYKAEYN